MNNNKIFNTFNITNDIEFEKLMSTITKEQSIFFLVEAAKFSYSKGVFSINETEIISKAIRTIYLPDIENSVNEKRDE